MKKLLLFLIASASWGAACSGANGYTFCQSLVLDHTKVPSNQSNYPAVITFGAGMGSNALTNTKQLATVAHGGSLQDNANGYDFIITSDSGAMTPLNYEAAIHNLTTGESELWVLLPSISSTVDLTIYLFYGNASVTTDQSHATAVWDANYLGVHHFTRIAGQYSNTDMIPDSTTANPFNVTTNSPTFDKPEAITAVVGGGANLGHAAPATNICCGFENGGPYTNFPPTVLPAPFTLEGWFNTNGHNTTAQAGYCIGDNSVDGDRWAILWDGPNSRWLIEGRNKAVSFSGPLTGWHRIVSILPSGKTKYSEAKVYIDGVSQTIIPIADATFTPLYGGNGYNAGILCGTLAFDDWAGYLDELRLSKIERSQDWVTTDYNNQSNVAAFWSQTAASGSKSRTIIIQ